MESTPILDPDFNDKALCQVPSITQKETWKATLQALEVGITGKRTCVT